MCKSKHSAACVYCEGKFSGFITVSATICIVFPNVCICQYFIPFCCWIVFHGMGNSVSLTVHGSKDIWVVFLFLLLWIKLLWIFVYRFLHEQRFSLLRDYCSWMKLLLCMVNVFMYGKSVFMSDCTTLC